LSAMDVWTIGVNDGGGEENKTHCAHVARSTKRRCSHQPGEPKSMQFLFSGLKDVGGNAREKAGEKKESVNRSGENVPLREGWSPPACRRRQSFLSPRPRGLRGKRMGSEGRGRGGAEGLLGDNLLREWREDQRA